jgi:hypothetical protein
MLVRATIGGVDVSDYITGLDATPAGPGAVATARLKLDDEGGGLSILYGMEVKVWRTFNAAGAGIAPRGRLFGGIVANRDTSHVINTRIIEVDCQSYNVLLARLVRDAQAAKAFSITAGTFAAQVLQLTQIIQQNGAGAVAQAIDATSQVVDLTSSMPAQVMEPGHTYGYYLKLLAQKAREVDPALRPAFFIDTDRTFGVAESFGSAVLHFYDAAETPTALYDYHTDPTGAEKQIYPPFKRSMEGAAVINRQQLVFGDGLVATYAEADSGADYPNPWINHGLTGNKGYWMGDPLSEGSVEGWANAQNAVRGAVQRTAYPRETISFPVKEHLLPGDVVTVTNPLEGISLQTMRVVEAKWDFESDQTDPWMDITLGARVLRLGEEGEEILVSPVAADVTPPSVPTWAASEAWVLLNEYDPETGTVSVEAELTLAEPGDMSHYIWTVTTGGIASQYRTEATDKVLELDGLPPNVDVDFVVEAYDVVGNGSGPSATETLHTATSVFWDNGNPNLSFEIVDAYDPTLPAGWTRTLTGGGTADLTTAEARDGNRSMALVLPANTDTASIRSRGVLVPGDARSALFTVHAKGSASINILTYTAYWFKKDNTASATPSTTLATQAAVTTSWARKTYTVLAPPSDAAYVRLEPKAEVAAGSNQTLWVDHLAVTFLTVGDELSDDLQYTGTMTFTDGGELVIGNSPTSNQIVVIDEDENAVGFINGEGTAGGGDRKMTISGQGVGGDLDISPDGDLLLNSGAGITISGSTGTTITGTATINAAVITSLAVNDNAALSQDTVSGNTTLGNHITVFVDTSGGIRTITLPAAAGVGGRVYIIKNIGTSKVTIDGNASETIDGNPTRDLTNQYAAVGIQSNGSNWFVLWSHLT